MSLADIKADLKAIVAEKSCGPIFIRLSWHDAGVYSTGKLAGGCPNAAMRFTDAGEGTFGANAGLPTVALDFLKPITEKYVAAGVISNADLWTLAANVGIEAMGVSFELLCGEITPETDNSSPSTFCFAPTQM